MKLTVITQSLNNIDIAELIKGKTAILSGKKYSGNAYENCIYYELDG